MAVEYLISFFVLVGSFFVLIAALGVVRMPDVYCRMHAATKAGAFGVSILLIALLLAAPSLRIIIQGSLIVLFFYLTAPLAAQQVGRMSLMKGFKQKRGTTMPQIATDYLGNPKYSAKRKDNSLKSDTYPSSGFGK